MAEVQGAEHNLLTTKWGPMPVWLWALIGLAVAWAYAKYKSSKATAAAASTATSSDTTGSDGTEPVAPQFVIENNMPADNLTVNTTSTPVQTPTGPNPPVVTPPGTAPGPPVATNPDKPPTTGKPPVTTKPPVRVVKPPVSKRKPPIQYKVVHGDTLSAIASRYHTTVAKLWTYNTTPGNRPASTIATLKSRGQNLLFAGETILIPQ